MLTTLQHRIGLVVVVCVLGGVLLFLATRKSHAEPAVISPAKSNKEAEVVQPVQPTATPLLTQPENKVSPPPVAPPVVIEHPLLQRFVDKNATNRLPTNFPEQVPTLVSDEEKTAVLFVLHDHTDSDTIRNEAANLLRRSSIKNLSGHFLTVLDAPGEKSRFRSFVVQHLGDLMVDYLSSTDMEAMTKSGAIRERLVKALTDQDLFVRRESVFALTRVRDPKVTAVIRSGLQDPAWSGATDLLIHCAYDADLSDLIPAIRPFAYDTQDVVRIAAINVLAQWKDSASRPAFEEASRSSVQRIQRAGTLAMQIIDTQP